MVVQFTNAKVLGNVRLGNLIAIFCKKHFLGYGEIMVITSSGVTVKLVIHVDKTCSEIIDDIKKYEPACIFCENAKDIAVYKNKNICPDCMRDLKK